MCIMLKILLSHLKSDSITLKSGEGLAALMAASLLDSDFPVGAVPSESIREQRERPETVCSTLSLCYLNVLAGRDNTCTYAR